MSPIVPFSSPLGALHYCPPQDMASHSLLALLRPSSTSAKTPSCPTPSSSKSTSRPFFKNSPRNNSTKSSPSSPPPGFEFVTASSASSDDESQPPAYYDLEEFDDLFAYDKITPEVAEARMKHWDSESAKDQVKRDREMGQGLRKLGL